MTRHIIDTPRNRRANRAVERFLKIERKAAPQPASKTLQKRPKPMGSGRLREFIRIDRGLRA